ncbi:Ppx/GppA phosphatase family protein [Eupransor demetentiae]|uniref:Exopolyphosphatase/pppGpp-phosphohydrolase (GppA) n=1 Tax=Eupransor demetentiae TaxID=3109584 RepID=A0ABM9N5N6_9LACO|nr:Exopolyphosphatase/pppGpp-phosphohydrolase (GppA) [Lactobacillaceae bacterium LMG 33000]
MAYLAIIDLGSNSTRMVVEDLHADGTYTELRREKQDTRISQNMGPELTLKPEPMARTIKVLAQFKKTIDQYGDVELRAITTAAVRTARNQSEFLDRVKKEVGIQLQVLTGQQEAHYDYLGVMKALPKIEDGVILDTGGASVELIGFKKRNSLHEVSLPFGAVNLSEKYHLANRVEESKVDEACQSISKQYQDLGWLGEFNGQPVILLGGANRSLARIARTFAGEREVGQIHGYEMSQEMVRHLFNKISHTDRAGREKIAGLEKSRADIIVSGLLPLLNLMKILNAPSVIFSESGVREGIIAEKMN